VVITYRDAVNRYRGALVRAALIRHGGNRTQAAAALGIERTYILKMIHRLQIDVPSNGPGRPT